MSADVDGARVFFLREKFCAETLTFMQRALSTLNCFCSSFLLRYIESCFNDETTEDDVCCCFCEE